VTSPVIVKDAEERDITAATAAKKRVRNPVEEDVDDGIHVDTTPAHRPIPLVLGIAEKRKEGKDGKSKRHKK
jgi:hypothetical protein